MCTPLYYKYSRSSSSVLFYTIPAVNVKDVVTTKPQQALALPVLLFTELVLTLDVVIDIQKNANQV